MSTPSARSVPSASARSAVRGLVVLAVFFACLTAAAQALAPAPSSPDASLAATPGARLPLKLPLVDSDGRAVRLGDYFDDRPVLLVLGYYRCAQLCGLLMQNLLGALQDTRLPRSALRIVRVSIDPEETPEVARSRRAADLAYAELLASATPARARNQTAVSSTTPLRLALLTGTESATRRLADAVGFRYALDVEHGKDDPGARFAHPAAVLVVTPDGRLSRTLPGVAFDATELRLALVEASQGRIGTLSDRIALLCAHVDPRLGRHTDAVLHGMRAFGVLLAVGLAGLLLVLNKRPRAADMTPRP